MSGRFVFSLDFELMWGVRDHRTTAEYGDAVLGVRKALPALLTLFRAHGVRATWATVGLLFARNRREMLEHSPLLLPAYRNAALSPYAAIRSQIGNDEASDSFDYGRCVVGQILQTDGQEIATHTYSHYYCLEQGPTLEAFDADLQAAIGIMGSAGVRPTSIVFPRDQMTDAHIEVCGKRGIRAFRGNPDSYAYRARSQAENSPLVRAVKLIDASIPVTSRLSYSQPRHLGTSVDIKASRFFRPFMPRIGWLNDLHVRRVIGEMTVAARRGEIYHLWCHPHNFGRYTETQLSRLSQILHAYTRLANDYGMRSETMSECAQLSSLNIR